VHSPRAQPNRVTSELNIEDARRRSSSQLRLGPVEAITIREFESSRQAVERRSLVELG